MITLLNRIKTSSNSSSASLCKEILKSQEKLEYITSLTSFIEGEVDLSFRLHYIRYSLSEQLTCKNCKSKLTKLRIQFCNKRCSANYFAKNLETQNKKADSLVLAHSKMTKERKLSIQEKREATNLKNGGHISNLHTVEGRKKVAETFISKYGKSVPSKNDEIRSKISKKNKAISDKSLIKRKNTCLQKYGVNNIMKLDENKEKIKHTNFEKYGASHPMQNEKYVNNFFTNNYKKFKAQSFKLPSGKVVKLLDCEPTVLDALLKKFNEDQITIGYDCFLKIHCKYSSNNKIHRYIPDFYIAHRNLVIEVKSEYTYKFAEPRKRLSVKEKGINFIYAIVSKDKIKFKRYESSKN